MGVGIEELKAEWIGGLIEAVGKDKVVTSESVREEFGKDRWHAASMPEAVVHAGCRDDVVATLKFANERGVPVTTRGAGVGYVGAYHYPAHNHLPQNAPHPIATRPQRRGAARPRFQMPCCRQ